MKQRKLETAALILTVFSALLFLPPLVLLFLSDHRVFGVPVALLYFFVAWAGVIGVSGWLAHRLPADRPPNDEGRR